MGINNDNWKEFFFESNEGMGTLYDRVILEKFFNLFVKKYNIKNTLDCPSFGMTGFSGINSIYLASKGVQVTVCEDNPERLNWIKKLWNNIGLDAEFILVKNWSDLPFNNRYFDLVWNLSSLWYLKEYDISAPIKELGRVTKRCLFICTHNKNQLFYPVWKMIEPDFIRHIKEEYSDEKILAKILDNALLDFNIYDEGYFVTTPWPGIILKKDQLLNNHNNKINKYLEINNIKLPEYVDHLNNPKLNNKIQRMMFLESLPNPVKKYWAHLKYWIFTRG